MKSLKHPRCTVCHHASLDEIDAALQRGEPYRRIAARFGLSASAVYRHTRHLARAIKNTQYGEDQRHLAETLDRLDLLQHRLDRLFHHSQDFHSHHVALGCLKESIRLLALVDRLRRRGRDRS